MTRSLGKEARGGISANLVQVELGGDIEGALRFLLSPRLPIHPSTGTSRSRANARS
ncbi:MAG: hypothetical protein CBARDCOR_2607 [uncultured Caballeronia sp.]|nr:MAG: hypothetical protein CBARDCOR_2607 [uncultured Caballeronia sp.]